MEHAGGVECRDKLMVIKQKLQVTDFAYQVRSPITNIRSSADIQLEKSDRDHLFLVTIFKIRY